MDIKQLIARMDEIESKKDVVAESQQIETTEKELEVQAAIERFLETDPKDGKDLQAFHHKAIKDKNKDLDDYLSDMYDYVADELGAAPDEDLGVYDELLDLLKEMIADKGFSESVQPKKESISSVLLKEMGYEFVREEPQPGFLDRVKGSIKSAQADRANFEKELAASNEPGAADKAKDNLTPSQLKWLGGADAADPYIRARMPKPQPGELTVAQQRAKDAEDKRNAEMDKELDSAGAEFDKLRAAQAAKPTQQSATPAAGNDELKKSEIAKAKDVLNKLKAAIFQKNQSDPLKKDAATAGALPKEKFEGKLSESEIIARLRQQLEAIDSRQDQEVDEIAGALGALGRGALNVGKNFISGLKGAGTVQQMGKAGQFGRIAKGGRTANAAGKAIAANPGKTALGTAVAGGAAGYGLSGGDEPAGQAATPAPAAPAAPAAGGRKGDPEVAKLQKELNDKFNAGLAVDGIMGPKTKAAQEKFMGGGQSGTPAADSGLQSLVAQMQTYRDSLSTMEGDPEVDALLKDIDKALQNAK